MRILVTGGAGYVGSVTVERLLAAGHDVAVVDDLSTGHRASVPFEAAYVDLRYGDVHTMTRLFVDQRIDAVLHCGAKSVVPESVADPALYYRENVVGISTLANVHNKENPAVQRLRGAIRKWKTGLSLWQKIRWYWGDTPGGTVELGFPSGEI